MKPGADFFFLLCLAERPIGSREFPQAFFLNRSEFFSPQKGLELFMLVFFGTSFYFVLKKKYTGPIAHIVSGITLLALLQTIGRTGGIRSPEMIWVVTFPIVVIGLAGWVQSLPWLAICLVFLTGTGFGIFPFQGKVNDFELQSIFSTRVPMGTLTLHLMMGFLTWGLMAVIRELKKRDSQLRQAVEDRENLSRILTHDIGNRIGVLRSVKDYFSQTDRPQHLEAKNLKRFSSSIDNLDEILGNVRAMLTVMSNHTGLQCQEVSLDSILENSIRDFEPVLEQKKIRLQIINENKKELLGIVEPGIFKEQVLGNIFSNAIKFSPVGGKIEVKIEKESFSAAPEDGAAFCRIGISNEGAEIQPEKIKNIFEFSGYNSTAGTLGEKGTGFGLPIVKRVAEMMKIEVSLQSETNKTTIFLRIPAKAA